MTQLRAALQAVEWDEELEGMGGTQAMDKFYMVLDREVKKFVPKKLRRKSSRPMWMNKNILRMIRKKRRLWRITLEMKDQRRIMLAMQHSR